MDVPGLLRGCLSPTTGDSATPSADGPARAASRHLQRVACGDLDDRLHPAPYPPSGPRAPHPTPHTPLHAMSEFFTLDNMEKVLNCVPLGVDPRSPNSRGAGSGPADGVARIFCGDGPTPAVFFGDAPQQEEPEARQDSPRPEGPRFTPLEHAALEREAARQEATGGDDRPGSLLQKVQATAWQLQNHLSPRNCGEGAGIGGLGFALRPHPAADGEEEEGAEAGGTPRAANRTPRGSAVPSSVLFGANDECGTPTEAAAQFPEAASPAVRIPGGLWHLHSHESHSSKDEDEGKHAAEEGEDEVMRMRSPAGAAKGAGWDGPPSPSSAEGPLDLRLGLAPPSGTAAAPAPAQPTAQPAVAPSIPPVAPGLLPAAQHAILAAQRAVSHATFAHSPPVSPNSQTYDDKYWMEDEVREGLAGVMQGFDAPHEASAEAPHEGDGLEGDEEENGGHGNGRDGYEGARHMLEDARAMLDDAPGAGAPTPTLTLPEEATPQDGADARLAHLLTELPKVPEAQPEATGAAEDEVDEPYTPGYHPYATDDEANAHFDAIMARFELRLPDRGDEEDRSKEKHAKAKRPSKQQRAPQGAPPVSPLMAKVAARRKRHSKEEDASSKASRSSGGDASFLAGTVGRKLNRRPSATSVDESTEAVEAEDEASSSVVVQVDDEAVLDNGTETVDALEDQKESTDATPPRPSLGASHRNKRGPRRTARHRPTKAGPREANEDCPEDEKAEAEEEVPDDEVASREAPSAGASEEIDESGEGAASAKGDRGLDGILGSINGSSFDSSVNWDALAYSVSMSDNGSANGAPEGGLATSEGPEPSPDVTGSIEVDAVAPVPATQASSARPPRQAKPQAAADAPLDVPAAIAEGVKAMHAPPVDQKEVSPSPEQRVATQASDAAKDANATADESLAPRAWERIERIKKQHDEDIGKIRSLVIGPDSVEEVALGSVPEPATEPAPEPAPLTRHASKQNDLTIETYSDEENVPLSPNAMSPSAATDQVKHRIDSMKRQHEREREQARARDEIHCEMTPRTHVRVEREVQSRISAMRAQHKANMERMRRALEEAQDGGASERPDAAAARASPRATDERHIAESVRVFKTNAARFEKARARFASHKATYSPSPRRQPAGHFSFDTSPEVASLGTPATPETAEEAKEHPHMSSPRDTSAKMKELMSKNEELEEEMRQIRLLSPKTSPAEAWTPLSPVRGLGASPRPRLHDAYTPSSARYASPSHYGVSPSSLLPDSPAQRQNLQEDIAQEAQMNTRITGLIADVQSFLEENDRAQERLMADLF